jgi:hypothetical protein
MESVLTKWKDLRDRIASSSSGNELFRGFTEIYEELEGAHKTIKALSGRIATIFDNPGFLAGLGSADLEEYVTSTPSQIYNRLRATRIQVQARDKLIESLRKEAKPKEGRWVPLDDGNVLLDGVNLSICHWVGPEEE